MCATWTSPDVTPWGSPPFLRRNIICFTSKMKIKRVPPNVVQHIGSSEFFSTCFGAFFVVWLSADTLIIFLAFSLVGFWLSGEGLVQAAKAKQQASQAAGQAANQQTSKPSSNQAANQQTSKPSKPSSPSGVGWAGLGCRKIGSTRKKSSRVPASRAPTSRAPTSRAPASRAPASSPQSAI